MWMWQGLKSHERIFLHYLMTALCSDNNYTSLRKCRVSFYKLIEISFAAVVNKTKQNKVYCSACVIVNKNLSIL